MRTSPGKTCPSCGEPYDPNVLFCPRDGTPLSGSRGSTTAATSKAEDPYLGVELGGQITLKSLIGIGSMGRVYRAFQAGIDRDVAVKILHRELSHNQELVGRFHREAKVASRLVHPNVVQVLMTGVVPTGSEAVGTGSANRPSIETGSANRPSIETGSASRPSVETGSASRPSVGGELYLVMEHLDGISLLSALAAAETSGDGAALPLPRALHVTLQMCDAVGEAHAQGIVHRDLKPENVMLVRRGEDADYVKVLDFGIARLNWTDKSMATQQGLIFGSAKYISPEGAEGLPVGPAADVYSITTMFYQMLAGRTPFEGDSSVALLVQHSHAPPNDLRLIDRSSYVPAPIAKVIMKNLAKKASDRAENARVLGRDLVAAARASGLFPEELTGGQSAFSSPASLQAVKLVSRERTKAHDLSADVAAKIAASKTMAAPEEAPAPTPAPGGSKTIVAAEDDPAYAVARGTTPARSSSGVANTVEAEPLPASIPTPAPGEAAAQKTPSPDRAADAAAAPAAAPSPAAGLVALAGKPPARKLAPKSRLARVLAIAACAILVAPVAIVGGRKLGIGGEPAAAADSADALLDEARECMTNRAWNDPPGHNVKDLTDQALSRWPDDTRVRALRSQASHLLVSEALGRKYSGDLGEAMRLADLAVQLGPDNATAQQLASELKGDAPRTAASTPSPSGERPSARASRVSPPPTKAAGGHDTRPPGPRPPAGPAVGPAAPVPSTKPSAAVPAARTAAPASTVPWL